MSKKRTSPESSIDKQTNEDSDSAEKTIRLEIVQTFQFPNGEGFAKEAIALKDELFILRKPLYDDTYYIHVYDLSNVAQVKDVIPLAGVEVEEIAACNVSNCLYLLNNKVHNLSILRVEKTDEHQFNISTLISGLRRRYDTMSVSTNGNFVLAWQRQKEQRAVITVYGPNGLLQHKTKLSSDVYSLFSKVIPKSNGNFVLVSANNHLETKLTEIDTNGSIVRQYQSSLQAWDCVCQIDTFGRIALFEAVSEIELLDSELNLLEYSGPQQHRLGEDGFYFWEKTHYNAERNEVVAVVDMEAVAILRFTEE